MTRRALVVGAGIAGLTAAIALRRSGYEVDIVEIAPDHSPVGAGIVLGANAVAALGFLGVDVTGAGVPVASMIVRSATGRLLAAAPVSALGPAVALARSTLHACLAAAQPAGVTLRFAESVTAVRPGPERVEVRLTGGGSTAYDLVIGADGLRSRVRSLTGLDRPTAYSGYTCWRVLVDDPGVGETVEYWGRGERVGLVPVDGDRVYAYLVRNAPPRDPGPQGIGGLRATFDGFPPIVAAVLARAEDADVMHHDLDELAEQVWGRGRVWLTGDAAHAMLPNLGQGAAMGIEDAVAIQTVLADGGRDPGAALAALVSARQDRVERVRRDSRRFGRIGQCSAGVRCRIRDVAYAALPAAVSDRQVRAVVQPGLDLVATAR